MNFNRSVNDHVEVGASQADSFIVLIMLKEVSVLGMRDVLHFRLVPSFFFITRDGSVNGLVHIVLAVYSCVRFSADGETFEFAGVSQAILRVLLPVRSHLASYHQYLHPTRGPMLRSA